MEKIFKKIRESREKRGYSFEYMAAELNIPESAYIELENNQSELILGRFLQIANILNVPISKLVGEKPYYEEYHQTNNGSGTFIGHQEIENYYQGSKND